VGRTRSIRAAEFMWRLRCRRKQSRSDQFFQTMSSDTRTTLAAFGS
jgi:hypothetical protein